MQIVDFRSDTLTQPTTEMRHAMSNAVVGDDVFGEDPTINRLQEKIADLTGKEAALFVTSGTQGNQIAINVHTNPGQEIIVDRNSHIFNYESGSPAMLSGVQLYPVDAREGKISPLDIDTAIRPDDDHYPQSGLICLENTLNRGGGTVVGIDIFRAIREKANHYKLPVHLDGARLWNACIADQRSVKDYCQYVDSVSLCFSKGLGAPVGSILAGTRSFIKKAHYYRKAYGGGLRQGGILAAAAIYAVDHHFSRLAEDHARARQLAEGIAGLPGISVDIDKVQSNILIFKMDPGVMAVAGMLSALQESGILMLQMGPHLIRAVTHLHITDADIDRSISAFQKILGKSSN